MDPINLHDTLRIYRHCVAAAAEWELPPFADEEYVCLVVLLAPSFSEVELRTLARRIIASPCSCVNSWGHECLRFADIVLKEFHRVFDEVCPEKQLIMTNWHDDDSIEDTVFHLLHCSEYDTLVRNFLLLFVGSNPDIEHQYANAIATDLRQGEDFLKLLSDESRAEYLAALKKLYKRSNRE